MKRFLCWFEAAENESAGRDHCCRMCERCWDARQEIGARGGIAAEL